jgi:suppressor of fused-like protein
MSTETARYLPLCIQGRLRHGFHFTLKSILKEMAVTFVVARVAGTLVTADKPLAAQGDWLQVPVTLPLRHTMYVLFETS